MLKNVQAFRYRQQDKIDKMNKNPLLENWKLCMGYRSVRSIQHVFCYIAHSPTGLFSVPIIHQAPNLHIILKA